MESNWNYKFNKPKNWILQRKTQYTFNINLNTNLTLTLYIAIQPFFIVLLEMSIGYIFANSFDIFQDH